MRRDIYGIQYLRAIAAIMIVVYHLSWQVNGHHAGQPLVTLKSGVDIFFVISGFVMIYSTEGGTNSSAGLFLRRRLARIAPLYLAATLFMIVMLLVAPKLVQSAKLVPMHAIKSLLFLPYPNPAMPTEQRPLVIPGWTLNIEMAFYALFSISMLAARGREKVLLAVAGIVLLIFTAIGLAVRPSGTLGFYTDPVILAFLYGMAIGYVVRHARFRRPPVPIVVALVAVAFLILIVPPAGPIEFRPFRFGLPAIAIVVAAIALPFPRWRLPHLLGDSSYSLYIIHFFVVSAVAQLWTRLHLWGRPASVAAFYLAGTCVALIAAVICWRFIERPLTTSAKKLLRV